MATKLTFEKRVEDAKKYVEEGEIKKAVSTLEKAIENDPEKDVDKKIETVIGELKVALSKLDPTEEVVEKVQDTKEFKEGVSKVHEEEVIPGTELNPTDDITEEKTVVETTEETIEPEPEEEEEKEKVVFSEKDLEVIPFRVTAPFMRNCVPFEVGDTINLPRKNDQGNIEPVE